MKNFFSTARTDKITYRCFLLSFFLLVITSGYTAFSYRKLPPLVPVFTQLPWGDARIGSRLMIFLPVAIGFFLFLVNIILAAVLSKTLPLLSRLLAITACFLSLLACIFTVRVILLVL